MLERINLILQDNIYKDADIIILNEAFASKSVYVLLNGLNNIGFEYSTPVLATSKVLVKQNCNDHNCWNAIKNSWAWYQAMNGGVAILSKYKIIHRESMIFSDHGCGFDIFAAKGVIELIL